MVDEVKRISLEDRIEGLGTCRGSQNEEFINAVLDELAKTAAPDLTIWNREEDIKNLHINSILETVREVYSYDLEEEDFPKLTYGEFLYLFERELRIISKHPEYGENEIDRMSTDYWIFLHSIMYGMKNHPAMRDLAEINYSALLKCALDRFLAKNEELMKRKPELDFSKMIKFYQMRISQKDPRTFKEVVEDMDKAISKRWTPNRNIGEFRKEIERAYVNVRINVIAPLYYACATVIPLKMY